MHTASVQTGQTFESRAAPPISLVRRHLLRACFLLIVVGQALTSWPLIFSGEIAGLPPLEGALNAMLAALGLAAVLGVLSPARMLPLMLFEILWKLVWVLVVALPLWLQGALTDSVAAILFACAWALPFVFVVPWRHVWVSYLRRTEPWR